MNTQPAANRASGHSVTGGEGTAKFLDMRNSQNYAGTITFSKKAWAVSNAKHLSTHVLYLFRWVPEISTSDT
jgi:hypothetical protein